LPFSSYNHVLFSKPSAPLAGTGILINISSPNIQNDSKYA
jgi:hypothetical protein